MPVILPICALKVLMNSMPTCPFFQNFRWPSIDAVKTMPCFWETSTYDTRSLCIYDFSYLFAIGILLRASCATVLALFTTCFAVIAVSPSE